MFIKLTVLCCCRISQDEIWNVTSQHNMFCFCSGGSCEWEDEDEEDWEQDYSITFLTPLNFSPASLHPLSHNHLLLLFVGTEKAPWSYFGGLITAEQTACLSQGPAGIISSHYYISAWSLCSSPEAPGLVIELWSTFPGPVQIDWSVFVWTNNQLIPVSTWLSERRRDEKMKRWGINWQREGEI